MNEKKPQTEAMPPQGAPYKVEFNMETGVFLVQIPLRYAIDDRSDRNLLMARGFADQVKELMLMAVAEERQKADAAASKIIQPGKVPFRVQ